MCTIEDHAITGGFGAAVVELANDEGLSLQSSIKRFGVQDSFVPHATQGEQHVLNGYDADSLVSHVILQRGTRQMVA